MVGVARHANFFYFSLPLGRCPLCKTFQKTSPFGKGGLRGLDKVIPPTFRNLYRFLKTTSKTPSIFLRTSLLENLKTLQPRLFK